MLCPAITNLASFSYTFFHALLVLPASGFSIKFRLYQRSHVLGTSQITFFFISYYILPNN